jgi:DNA gyrase subunit B
MRQLIETGHLYIAQPPLYRITRRGKKQYVQDDRALQKVLVELGTSDARLECRLNGEAAAGVLEKEEFRRLLEQVSALERLMRQIERRGIPFARYLALRDGKRGGQFPRYRVLHNDEQGATSERFFYTEDEYDRFVQGLQQELRARGQELEIIEEDDYEGLARGKDAPDTLRPRKFLEAAAVEDVVAGIEKQGIPIDCLLRAPEEAGRPAEENARARFTVLAGEESATVGSLAEVIPTIREMGRKGLEIERYKGLGEMNAGELAETTLQPATRALLRVGIGDAIKADNYFSILAGRDVKQRREFIELHALEVQNLDT